MKKVKKETSNISNESKSEIKELFDELFVGDINSNLTQMSSKSEEAKSQIEDVVKQVKKNQIILEDWLGKIEEYVSLLGSKDDWNEITLDGFLNMLAQQIAQAKDEIINNVSYLNDITAIASKVISIEQKIEQIQKDTEDISQKDYSSEFKQLYDELKQIDGIIGKLSILETGIDAIKDKFASNGVISDIKNSLEGLCTSYADGQTETIKKYAEISVLLSDLEQKVVVLETGVSENGLKVDQCNTEVKKYFEEYSQNLSIYQNNSKKQINMLAIGIGVSVFLNIILLVMQIL